MDFGLISTVKVRNRRSQMELALDFIDEDARDIYKLEIILAMCMLKCVWLGFTDSVIRILKGR